MTISTVTIYREIEETGEEIEITATCETTKYRGDRDNPPEYDFNICDCSVDDLSDYEYEAIRDKAWQLHD